MDTFFEIFGKTQGQAIAVALFVQITMLTISRLLQQRPKITFTKSDDRHYLVRPQQQPQPQLPLDRTENVSDDQQLNVEPAPDSKGEQRQINNVSVYVADYTVTNTGRLAAKNVEIVFNYPPGHYDRFPHLPIREATLQDGRYVLTVGMLNPRESLNIGLLNVGTPLPALTLVRCEGYGAKEIATIPMRIWPKWFNVSAAVAMLFGVFSFLYLIALAAISLV